MIEKYLAEEYINRFGDVTYDPYKFNDFLMERPHLAHFYSKSELEKLLKQGLADMKNKLDVKVSSKDLKPFLEPIVDDINKVLAKIENTSISDAYKIINLADNYIENKALLQRIKKAFNAVYGENLSLLGIETSMVRKAADENKEEDKNKMVTKETVKPKQLEEVSENKEGDYLDPDLEKDILLTLQNYLQKYIFNSKLIPEIKILKAFAVKNGYVIDLEFSSFDGKVKAFAKAVVHNKKLVPPAELEDSNGNKIGDFNKETFLSLFAVNKKNFNKMDYQELSDEMMKSPSYIQASKVLNIIKEKYGPDIARQAFENYITLRLKRR